jgi:hypothetical protein
MKRISAIALMVLACAGDAPEQDAPPVQATPPTQAAPDTSSQSTAAAPSADTVGLGKAIAEHFPGYHLSTEPEIAARFPLTDGSKPADYIPAWGSGRVWWIWPAELDGDARPDRAVLLTKSDDPSLDLLIALHGNGTAARITEPGGWGVEIDGRDVIIVAWEKSADRFRWDGTSYVLQE